MDFIFLCTDGGKGILLGPATVFPERRAVPAELWVGATFAIAWWLSQV